MLILKRPWDSQPQESAQPDDHWLARGLVYASTLLEDSRNAVDTKESTVTGTKLRASGWGRARGFGATLGVGTGDRIATSLATNAAARTYVIRYRRNGAGGAGFGRLYDSGGEVLLIDSAGDFVQFNRAFSTTGGQWKTPASIGSTIGFNYSFVVTHDGTTAAPAFYRNGEAVTPTTITTPVGSLTLGASAFVVGNRSAGDRNFDGEISDFYVFNSVLTAAELAELSGDIGALWASRRIYIPGATAGGGGGATVTLPSAAGTSAAGTISATGGASVALTGAASTAQAGTLTATGGATVVITGAGSTAAVGVISGNGGAVASIVGAATAAAVGAISASASGSASTTLPSVFATAAPGAVSATGSATVTLTGAAVAAAVGDITASLAGDVSVTLQGASVASAAGAISATSGAVMVLPSAVAAAFAGTISTAGEVLPASEYVRLYSRITTAVAAPSLLCPTVALPSLLAVLQGLRSNIDLESP